MEPKHLTPEAFQEWRHHPVTQAVLLVLDLQVKQAQETWARGEYRRDKELELGVLGKISAYRAIDELNYEQLISELTNE